MHRVGERGKTSAANWKLITAMERPEEKTVADVSSVSRPSEQMVRKGL